MWVQVGCVEFAVLQWFGVHFTDEKLSLGYDHAEHAAISESFSDN